MVDLVGIEPTTSSMPWKRAPNCATGPHCERISSGFGLREGTFIILAYILRLVNACFGRMVAQFELWSSTILGVIPSRAVLHAERGSALSAIEGDLARTTTVPRSKLHTIVSSPTL